MSEHIVPVQRWQDMEMQEQYMSNLYSIFFLGQILYLYMKIEKKLRMDYRDWKGFTETSIIWKRTAMESERK
jgi:hypothetical protein